MRTNYIYNWTGAYNLCVRLKTPEVRCESLLTELVRLKNFAYTSYVKPKGPYHCRIMSIKRITQPCSRESFWIKAPHKLMWGHPQSVLEQTKCMRACNFARDKAAFERGCGHMRIYAYAHSRSSSVGPSRVIFGIVELKRPPSCMRNLHD